MTTNGCHHSNQTPRQGRGSSLVAVLNSSYILIFFFWYLLNIKLLVLWTATSTTTRTQHRRSREVVSWVPGIFFFIMFFISTECHRCQWKQQPPSSTSTSGFEMTIMITAPNNASSRIIGDQGERFFPNFMFYQYWSIFIEFIAFNIL